MSDQGLPMTPQNHVAAMNQNLLEQIVLALEEMSCCNYNSAAERLRNAFESAAPDQLEAKGEPCDLDYRRWAGQAGAMLRDDSDLSRPYAIFHNATQWMKFCAIVRSAKVEAKGEHYDELKATLQGLHTFCENISAIERRVGPLGSHARGYTHKITKAIQHLDALAKSEDEKMTAWWTAWKAASAVSLAPTQAAEPLSGWVSVEERLPEHGVDVLAFWFPRIGPVHSGCFGTTYMNEIGLWVNPEDSDDHYNVPTHWHPIPSVEGIQPSGGGQ